MRTSGDKTPFYNLKPTSHKTYVRKSLIWLFEEVLTLSKCLERKDKDGFVESIFNIFQTMSNLAAVSFGPNLLAAYSKWLHWHFSEANEKVNGYDIDRDRSTFFTHSMHYMFERMGKLTSEELDSLRRELDAKFSIKHDVTL